MIPLRRTVLIPKTQRTLTHLHIAPLIIVLLKVALKLTLLHTFPPHFLLLVNSTVIGHVSFLFIQMNSAQVLSCRL